MVREATTASKSHGDRRGIGKGLEPSKAPQPPRLPDETDASRPDAVGEQAKTSSPRAGSKLARVIDLPQRCDGAMRLIPAAVIIPPQSWRNIPTNDAQRDAKGNMPGCDSLCKLRNDLFVTEERRRQATIGTQTAHNTGLGACPSNRVFGGTILYTVHGMTS
jgi:hypothetical protein